MPNLNLIDDETEDDSIGADDSTMEEGQHEGPGIVRRALPFAAGGLIALVLTGYILTKTDIIQLWGTKKTSSVMVDVPQDMESQILSDSAMTAQFAIDSAQIAAGPHATPTETGRDQIDQSATQPQEKTTVGSDGRKKKEANEAIADAASAKKLAEENTASNGATAKKLAKEQKAADAAAEKKLAEEKKVSDAAVAKKLAEEKKAAEVEKKKKANETIADAATAKKLAKEQKAADAAAEKKLAEEKKVSETAAAKKLAEEKKAAELAAAKKIAEEKKAADAAAVLQVVENRKRAEEAQRNRSYIEVPGYTPRRGAEPVAEVASERTSTRAQQTSVKREPVRETAVGERTSTRAQQTPVKREPVNETANEQTSAKQIVSEKSQEHTLTGTSPSGDGEFSVQISSWPNETKANAHARRFTEAGIPAFVVLQGRLYRVCIGRFASRTAARSRGEELTPMLETHYTIIQVK